MTSNSIRIITLAREGSKMIFAQEIDDFFQRSSRSVGLISPSSRCRRT
jgi:hypothetical protein